MEQFLCFHKWSYIYSAFTKMFCLSLSILGIKQADEEEMKLMASTPYRSHIFNVADFNVIKNVQKKLITQVCAGVDDQLNILVSGEEGEMLYLEFIVWEKICRLLSLCFLVGSLMTI